MNEIKIAAGESKQVRIKATKEGWLDSAIAEYNYIVLTVYVEYSAGDNAYIAPGLVMSWR